MPALERAYHRLRKEAAVGVDGITKEQYGQDLERNLQDLHARLRSQQYRHQPIRRVHIPKDQGTTRPIGVSAFEDKLVQDALREVLEAIYEQDFLLRYRREGGDHSMLHQSVLPNRWCRRYRQRLHREGQVTRQKASN